MVICDECGSYDVRVSCDECGSYDVRVSCDECGSYDVRVSLEPVASHGKRLVSVCQACGVAWITTEPTFAERIITALLEARTTDH